MEVSSGVRKWLSMSRMDQARNSVVAFTIYEYLMGRGSVEGAFRVFGRSTSGVIVGYTPIE